MNRCDRFTLLPSATARVVFVLVPFFTAICILILPVDGPLATFLVFCLVVNLIWYRVRGNRLAELQFREGEWRIRERDVANEHPCQLKTAVVLPGVVRLIFEMDGHRLSQLIFPDSLPEWQWRALHRLLNNNFSH